MYVVLMYINSGVHFLNVAPRPSDVPGGRWNRPPDDLVGRYRDAEAVLASLPHSGAVLVGDRRHGKTSLARLVQRNVAAAGDVVIAASAERETYADFVSALAAELARLEPTWARRCPNCGSR